MKGNKKQFLRKLMIKSMKMPVILRRYFDVYFVIERTATVFHVISQNLLHYFSVFLASAWINKIYELHRPSFNR